MTRAASLARVGQVAWATLPPSLARARVTRYITRIVALFQLEQNIIMERRLANIFFLIATCGL
jgi:hypothetical protein